jgi:hypothetical protein
MKKYCLLLLLPLLFLTSCGKDDKKDDGITLPTQTSVETSIDYSNDREGKGDYTITSFTPVESISWNCISTSTSTKTSQEEDDGNLTLPTKAE